MKRLAERRQALGFRTPVILAGDQVYVDATAGLFDPSLRDQPFKRAYDRLREQHWRAAALALTTPVALMDDHEVIDNWEPSLNRARAAAQAERMWMGRYEFLQRQRQRNPDPIDAPRGRRSLWQLDPTLLQGRLLFIGDTRSERSARDPGAIGQAQIMSARQAEALRWALTGQHKLYPGQLKFVATPSMLLPRRLSTARAEGRGAAAAALRSDAWCGYPGSLHALLGDLVDDGVQGCVFLSGNEHIPCVAHVRVCRTDKEGRPQGPTIQLWSVHAGALYAPFPFANACAEDFAETDDFRFQIGPRKDRDEVDPRHYRCQVAARFPPPGDGFVELQLHTTAEAGPAGLTEALTLHFHRSTGAITVQACGDATDA